MTIPALTYYPLTNAGANDATKISSNFKLLIDAITDGTYDLTIGSLVSNGNVSIKNGNEIRLYDDDNYVGFKAPTLSANQIWALPVADGNVNESIITNGAGALSFDLFSKASIMNEPTGFPNRTDSALSFVAGTRTFTIAPTGSSFEVWEAGVQYTISASTDIIIPDTSGLHVIYYEAGVLSQMLNPSHSQIDDIIINHSITALIYWNANDGVAHSISDERHGTIMSGETHHYLHDTIGATYNLGLTASDYVLATDSDVALTFQVSNGDFYDEDIAVDIEDGDPAIQYEQQLNGGDASIPVMYRDDIDGTWTEDAASTLPYKNAGGGNLTYMNDDGDGTYSQVALTNNRYMVFWLVATNDWQYPVKMIQGTAQYTTKNGALEGAATEIISWGDYPSPETVLLYQFIMQSSSGFGGTKNAKIVEVVDYRGSGISGASANPTSHSSLSDLSNDDHVQYLLADGTRALTAAWDAGSFGITAETFTSDIATGTAPLTVASATLVSNLNADLLDGNEAADFSLSTHRHDGQTLQLDAVNSDGGAFAFDTTGNVSFNQSVEVDGTLGVGTSPTASNLFHATGSITAITDPVSSAQLSATWTPSGNNTKAFRGINGVATLSGTSNIGKMHGLAFQAYVSGGSGTISEYMGIDVWLRVVNSTRSVSGDAVGLNVRYSTSPAITVSGSSYQVKLEDYSAGYTTSGTEYGIRQEGASLLNDFDGDIAISTDNGLLALGAAQDATIRYNGTDMIVDPAVVGSGTMKVQEPIKIKESAAAASDSSSYGQLWVKNTSPCQLWFTDDTGTDTQIV